MTGRFRDRLSYANVTATIALFVALGGTSYAAVKLPKNSVGATELRSSSVRTAEVKDRALELRDLSVKARAALKGQTGAAGPAGPAGAGTGGAASLTVKGIQGNVGSDSTADLVVQCDAGQRVVGGGMRLDTGGDTSVRESYPSNGNTAWTVKVGNDTPPTPVVPPAKFTAFAICTT
jgi:hypothetical protein